MFLPCGFVAGVYARTDSVGGVWKALAGIDASSNGVADLQVEMADAENGFLSPPGINCLPIFLVNRQVV